MLRGNEIEVKNTNTIRTRKTEKTGLKTANVAGTEKNRNVKYVHNQRISRK
jgi:hypothetical protein